MTEMNRRSFLAVAGVTVGGFALSACGVAPAEAQRQAAPGSEGRFPFRLTDAQWRQRLSPEAYQVLRHADTERPGSSPLLNEHRRGTFACAGCNQALFDSATKFDSGTGWPSFYQALPRATVNESDNTLGMQRTEVLCSNCGGHLGHVFDDGPQPTGLRYCMNGVALAFHAA